MYKLTSELLEKIWVGLQFHLYLKSKLQNINREKIVKNYFAQSFLASDFIQLYALVNCQSHTTLQSAKS